jgi:TRAP-type mannitol/chloroaromatic compound transport system permease large subunit
MAENDTSGALFNSAAAGRILKRLWNCPPEDTTMGDIIKSAAPFLGCDLIVMITLIAFPSVVLLLPSLM